MDMQGIMGMAKQFGSLMQDQDHVNNSKSETANTNKRDPGSYDTGGVKVGGSVLAVDTSAYKPAGK